MSAGGEFVFGYGSLVGGLAPAPGPARRRDPSGFVASLSGAARRWGVAMDNSVDLPGYKFYEHRDGERPRVFVAYLDLFEDPAPDAAVNGVCLPVGELELAELDVRERNYERVEVSDRLDRRPAGFESRVWAYVGRPQARERLAEGRRRGRAVIDAGYLRSVRRGFRELGADQYEICADSLEPGGLPVLELVRRELSGG